MIALIGVNNGGNMTAEGGPRPHEDEYEGWKAEESDVKSETPVDEPMVSGTNVPDWKVRYLNQEKLIPGSVESPSTYIPKELSGDSDLSTLWNSIKISEPQNRGNDEGMKAEHKQLLTACHILKDFITQDQSPSRIGEAFVAGYNNKHGLADEASAEEKKAYFFGYSVRNMGGNPQTLDQIMEDTLVPMIVGTAEDTTDADGRKKCAPQFTRLLNSFPPGSDQSLNIQSASAKSGIEPVFGSGTRRNANPAEHRVVT